MEVDRDNWILQAQQILHAQPPVRGAFEAARRHETLHVQQRKTPRTFTLIGSVLRSMPWATAFSVTGSFREKVSTVASAAAAQLVSHFCTMTPSWRSSNNERTGFRSPAFTRGAAMAIASNHRSASLAREPISFGLSNTRWDVPLRRPSQREAQDWRRVKDPAANKGRARRHGG